MPNESSIDKQKEINYGQSMSSKRTPDTHNTGNVCRVAPAPNVLRAIRREMQANSWTAEDILFRSVASRMGVERSSHRMGFNDGIFYPEEYLPEGLSRVAATRPSIRTRMRKTTGSIRILVILVDFSDNEGQRSPQDLDDLLFSLDKYPTGSLRDYYREVSYGKLDVTGRVVGWLRMPHRYRYYVDGDSGTSDRYPTNSQGLTEDALREAAQNLNLEEFDVDGDGFLDGLFIVHAGEGAEAIEDAQQRRNMIWSHKGLLTQSLTLNGVAAYSYSVEPEDGCVGVFAHEFGHLLGLPDLYDTTYRSAGAGAWCLMANGAWGDQGKKPAHPCAWAKAHLGWLEPRSISVASSTTLLSVEGSSDVCRLWKGGQHGPEYFLIENRQRQGFDLSLPGGGLLIWHIDDRQSNNDDALHYRVGLKQADGRRDLERGQNDGDEKDPYNSPACFDDTSKPNSRDYFGDPTGVAVRNIIQGDSGAVTADLEV